MKFKDIERRLREELNNLPEAKPEVGKKTRMANGDVVWLTNRRPAVEKKETPWWVNAKPLSPLHRVREQHYFEDLPKLAAFEAVRNEAWFRTLISIRNKRLNGVPIVEKLLEYLNLATQFNAENRVQLEAIEDSLLIWILRSSSRESLLSNMSVEGFTPSPVSPGAKRILIRIIQEVRNWK